jgi:hypothetical protein
VCCGLALAVCCCHWLLAVRCLLPLPLRHLCALLPGLLLRVAHC